MRVSRITIRKSLIILSFLIPLVLVGCNQLSKVPKDAKEVKVKRVFDGDTFETTRGEKVRLVGVDTPESVKANHPLEAYGKKSSNFTKEMIEGKIVYLTFDVGLKMTMENLSLLHLEDGTFSMSF